MALNKCSKRKEVEEDRFRQLPVCLRTRILSFVPLKDAAATSILSKYWRRIWLFSDVWDFDAFKVFNHPPTPKHTPEYVKWISDVLQSHREATRNDDVENSSVLKKLRIRMHLDKSFQNQLHEWISYASECRVQCLELDFMVKSSEILVPFFDLCSFSDTFAAETDLTCLTSLSLAAVNVTGEVVHSLLRKCPFLESLKVCRSDVLKSLEICGSSLALKHLEVSYCSFAHLTVHDTSIVSLTVTWLGVLLLYNNPKLVVVRATHWVSPCFRSLEFCLHQLEVLTVCTCLPSLPGRRNKNTGPLVPLLPLPQLLRMKQLTLYVDPLREDSVNFATNLLRATPKLEKLGLEFVYKTKKWVPTEGVVIGSPRFPHAKVVEVRGYYGDLEEDKTLKFIFQHAEAPPEKIIFDLHNLGRDMYPPRTCPRAGVKRSEDERVERFRRVVPSSAEFTVT